jgi:hypothetical protein
MDVIRSAVMYFVPGICFVIVLHFCMYCVVLYLDVLHILFTGIHGMSLSLPFSLSFPSSLSLSYSFFVCLFFTD